MKFAELMVVVGLITDNDGKVFLEEDRLTVTQQMGRITIPHN